MNFHKTMMILLALLLAAGLASGCSDGGPTAPKTTGNTDTGGDTLLTPTYMVIETFRCTQWPKEKPNGSAWDPFGGKPDIYLTMGTHRSEVYENWSWQTPFTASFPSGWSFPVALTATLEMWDQDASNDDLMARSSWAPIVWYQQDNAQNFSFVDTVKDTRIEIYGHWVYE